MSREVDAKNSRTNYIAIVLAILLAVVLVPAVNAWAKDCGNTATGLIPLTDLGTGTYQGEVGGLYPDGSNEIPDQHLELGLELAAQVVPRAADGTPDEHGLIGFTSIGVSNTKEMFKAFTEKAVTSEINPALVLVNGAQQGRPLEQWGSPNKQTTWNTLEKTVARAGLTAEQIQVAWLMLPARTRGPRTLSDARDEIEALKRVLQFAKERYPNLAVAYLSSREYGGYISDSDSEPNAYNHGFGVKWLIEEQINGSPELNADPEKGTVVSPWIAWGAYLWADGTTPRSDGLVYSCQDFTAGGVHPAPAAEEKIATLMMEHFLTDQTAVGWFSGTGAQVASTTTVPSTTFPSTTVPSTLGTSSPSTPETTMGSVPPTSIGVAQEDSDAEEGTSSLPSALTGLGAGLILGALVALAIRRSGPGTGEHEPP